MRRALLLSSLMAALGACIIQRGQKDPAVGAPNDFVGAAVYAATGAGAAVVNRKVTGECYASCPAGRACDRASGLCEPIVCSCPADLVCERAGAETACVQPRRSEEATDAGAASSTMDAGDDGDVR